MYYLIENGPIRWPENEKHGFSLTSEAQDLIGKLLNKDKKSRLGKVGDSEDVLSHPWFSEIDRTQLLTKKMQAPYIPTVKTEDDTSNFDEKFQRQEIIESVIDDQKIRLI